MFQRNRNKILMALVLLMAITGMGFLSKEAEPLSYTNLKVLPKDITKEQMNDMMEGFNIALGVKCNYCHIKTESVWDMAADDDPEKAIARKMFTMTRKIIKKYFGVDNKLYGTVTCMTCHQGGSMPKSLGE